MAVGAEFPANETYRARCMGGLPGPLPRLKVRAAHGGRAGVTTVVWDEVYDDRVGVRSSGALDDFAAFTAAVGVVDPE